MNVRFDVLSVPKIQTYQVGLKVWPHAKKLALASVVIDTVRKRARDLGRGLEDGQLKPYSDYGPIYVPITGGKTGQTKTSLKGVEVITQKDLATMRKRAKAKRGPAVRISKTKKTVRFENWAEYKKSLGKSGRRDLELSGRMLRSIVPVRIGAKEIIIGFGREEEMKKARGNQKISPWWGFSPSNRRAIVNHAARIAGLPLKKIEG